MIVYLPWHKPDPVSKKVFANFYYTVCIVSDLFWNLICSGPLQNVNYEVRIEAEGELRGVIHDGMVAGLQENSMEFEEMTIVVSEMEVDSVHLGSVIVRIHPLTDNGIQQLLDAKKNNTMSKFIQNMFEKSNLQALLVGQKIKLKVEVRPQEPGVGKQRHTGIFFHHKEKKVEIWLSPVTISHVQTDN